MKRFLGVLMFAVACVHDISIADANDPALPAGKDPGGVAVAIIDSGVNYVLATIASKLARDPFGNLIGYDFHDDDNLPFDLKPGQNSETWRGHGTKVAGILLREAPNARLVPYRYRAQSFESFARIVESIASGPARIVNISLGGYRKEDWMPFYKVASRHREILFIMSAGNDGRNVDSNPIYPSGFKMVNSLVVTATDSFGRLLSNSNWGPETVDLAVPANELQSINHFGANTIVSGSGFDAPRVTALAARFLAAHPNWTTAQIKQAILKLAGPPPGDRRKRTKHGWIANPALAGPTAQ